MIFKCLAATSFTRKKQAKQHDSLLFRLIEFFRIDLHQLLFIFHKKDKPKWKLFITFVFVFSAKQSLPLPEPFMSQFATQHYTTFESEQMKKNNRWLATRAPPPHPQKIMHLVCNLGAL